MSRGEPVMTSFVRGTTSDVVAHVWLNKTQTNMSAEPRGARGRARGRAWGRARGRPPTSRFPTDRQRGPFAGAPRRVDRGQGFGAPETGGKFWAAVRRPAPTFTRVSLKTAGGRVDVDGGLPDQWTDGLRPRGRAGGTAAVRLRRRTHLQVKTR